MTLRAAGLIPVSGVCIIISPGHALVRLFFTRREGKYLKRLICAMLLVGLLAATVGALAAGRMTDATMIYEDYDGQRCEQTVVENDTLQELQDMLQRARKNKVDEVNTTMNCTLFCRFGDDKLFDFAIATDGSAYMSDMGTGSFYRFTDDDLERLWEIFDLVQETMGYDASMVF